jgi:hypothetical protein
MHCFIKRPLTEDETNHIDLERLGIEQSRRPPPCTWEWAVDEQNAIYFTQLISSSGAFGEMREGRYFYLLVIADEPLVIVLTGFTVRTHKDTPLEEAQFLNFWALPKHDLSELMEVANAAATVLCCDHRPFAFKENDPVSRFPLASYGGFKDASAV